MMEMVEQAVKMGADEAEVYLRRTKETTIKVHKGKVDSFSSADTVGLGIRVFVEGAMGYAYTSELSDPFLAATIKAAVDNARVTASDEFNGLPEPTKTPPSLVLYRETLANTSRERKIELALELEQTALDYDRRIIGSEQVVYADEERRVFLSNSRGFCHAYDSTLCAFYLSVLAREGVEIQTGSFHAAGRSPEELNVKQVGQEAAQRALSLLGARVIPTTEAPVILDPKVGAQLLALIAQALSADAVQKGRSPFGDRMGEVIASGMVTLVDDGAMEEGIASTPFDGEGVPTQRTEVLREGRLLSLLHNSYTARKGSTRSTGNARRSSHKSPPEVGPSNFFLVPGTQNPEELLEQTEKGFYVMELKGVHAGANPVTGEFSVGTTGLWIEKGKRVYPVREVTIASTMQEMLKGIDGVGTDLRFLPLGGNFGAPTLRLRGMSISGK